MATLTPPKWTPNPVTTLPQETTVEFVVTPDNETGVQIRYRISSPRLRFRPAGSAMIRPEEAARSDPAPTPVSRTDRVVIDEYPDQSGATGITRALSIERVGSEDPGIATIVVTASDLDDNREPTNASEDRKTIAFVLT